MLRPSTLFRAAVAPTRCLFQAPIRTPFLARRFLTTEAPVSPEVPPASQPQQQQDQPQQEQQPAKPRPFSIGRTVSANFAVYQRAQRGGNKHLTVIKKVSGDRQHFKQVLANGLGISLNDVTVNSLTGHIVVAGHRREAIEQWLKREGF